MKRAAFAKTAISSLILGTTMVGCTGAAFRPSAIAPQTGSPDRLAATAEKALVDRDGARAVSSAEALVQAAPNNAGHRQLLGRAYVASGRFASAETALGDAISLGNRDARTIITLTLVKVALGKAEAARDLLAANADIVPAGDYGLAMAMAGDAEEGARILAEAIHDPSATAQTRQNLAYAYALAGRWKDARLVAGLDLDALAANQRIAQWAQTAASGFATQRVAALMGVTVDGADSGQPAALALAPAAAPTEAATVEMAQAAEPESAAENVAPSEFAAAAIAPTEPPVAPFAVAMAPQAAASAVRAPMLPERPIAPRLTRESREATAPRRIQASYRMAGRGTSNWVVQLGAYDSTEIAREKWYSMARRDTALAALPVLTSQITVNGATYARLAVSGFNDRAEANALCRAIRTRRGQCFVRENASDAAPQRWALTTKGRQFASR